MSRKSRNGARHHTEPNYSEIQRRLDYVFRSPAILANALNPKAKIFRPHQGMEKEGDRLLGAITVNILRTENPEIRDLEGELSRRESHLTRNENLSHLAVRLELPSLLARMPREPIFDYGSWADLMEAIFCSIAEDAGAGDTIAGMIQLRRVVRRLLHVDLQLCQIENPWEILHNQVRQRTEGKEKIRIRSNVSYIEDSPAGYTASLFFGPRISKKLGCERISGTGVSERMALQKASALALLYLWPSKYPHTLPNPSEFSWRIKAKFENGTHLPAGDTGADSLASPGEADSRGQVKQVE